jgi:formate hydrogenlyase subunit 6/NADH:ubiquinone oxidoreductase subunit I
MIILTMTKTVLKSFFRPSYTVKYPKVIKPFSDIYRGKISNNIEKCTLCRVCSIKCPTQALRVDKTTLEWEINQLACITCGYCVEVCPKKCLTMLNSYSSSVINKTESVFLLVQKPAAPPKTAETEKEPV